MTAPVPLIVEDELPAARSAAAFEVHRAACEWQLDRPVLIGDASEVVARDQIDVTPYEHQVQNLITFCRRAPVALLADDVGLGKTISAGLILTELIHRRRVRKALVVCPSILVAQWEEELASKFRLPVITAKGRKLHEAAMIERGVIVTTYETARDHLNAMGDRGMQLLILDEAHRMRHLHGSHAPPRVATEIRCALARRWFRYLLLLTATPVQNRVWDLYSLLDLLVVAKGEPHPLGTPQEFAQRYIRGPRDRAIEIQPWRLAEFRTLVRGYITRTRRSDAGLVFPRREVWLRRVNASEDEQELARMLGAHVDQLDPLAQISLAQALMSSPHAFLAQLENMVPKARHLGACLTAARAVVANGALPAKLAGLGVIVRELRDARPEDFRLVVFTGRRETQTAIGEFLAENDVPHGFIRGGSARENRATIDAFTRACPQINVIVSTDAGAEGVNLQAANVLVNYDLPWNPMVMEQRIGRVQRLGSEHATVTVLNLIVRDSVEERVVARLTKKLQLVSDAAFEIDAILESCTSADSEGDAGEAFEDVVGQLVVESLQGKDVDEALRCEEESLDRARLLLEENQHAIEAQIGGLGAARGAGPSVPALPAPEPSMPLETFVLRALEEDGAAVTSDGSGTLTVEPSDGSPFAATTDGEGAPPGLTVYAPGESAFEALVARWAVHEAALIYDHGVATDDAVRTMAEQWCARIEGATLHDVERLGARTGFQGEIDCLARAVVAHDSYAKLVPVKLLPEGHSSLAADLKTIVPLDTSPCATSLFDGGRAAVERAVSEDPDLQAFCGFYEERFREEQAGILLPDAGRRLEDLFSPTVEVRTVGVRGQRYEVVRLRVAVDLDDGNPYEAELEVSPVTADVVTEPELGTCEQSGRRVPLEWLGTCAISSRRALRHLLRPIAGTGELALVGHLARSAVTGAMLLVNELEASAVSGALAEPEHLVASELSGRKALPSEVARCEFTGTTVLRDELVRSDVSGRLLREDQQATSAVSGVRGHADEFVVCSASATSVLPQETGRSDLSGQVVRKDWLVTSEKPPHRSGSLKEARRCDKTGTLLLLDEGEYSRASLRWVDAELLVKSEASALVALPEELVVCELSGQRVLGVETALCAVTRRRARCDLMVQSAASGRYMIPGHERRSALSGKPMVPSEVFTCPWLGIDLLPQEARTCARTGVRVAPTALNAAGELAELRRVLDDPKAGNEAPAVAAWLRGLTPSPFVHTTAAFAIRAPSGRLLAIAAKCEQFLFRHFLGCIAEDTGAGPLRLAGHGYTVGYLQPRGWVLAKDVKTDPGTARSDGAK